jgi:hypothetical protein
MGGVPWPQSRVQVRQTEKEVAVQRCGLTSDRKVAPRPPATVSSPNSEKAAFSQCPAFLGHTIDTISHYVEGINILKTPSPHVYKRAPSHTTKHL